MSHPTGKVPKKVILVGLGPSKSEYMNIMASDAVTIDADEVWGVNGAGAVIKVDLSFAMDDYLTCVNRTPGFAKWFENATEPFFTSISRNPKALNYPLQEVLSMPGARPYFNGSVSYIAAYAAMIGVEELTIFGCDYIMGGLNNTAPRQNEIVSRYLACMSYWLGFCSARGMKVVVCPSSPLLDADYTQLEQFYGYIVKPFITHTNLPGHLGGSFGRCHVDQGTLDYLRKSFSITSFLDIGCGTGGMVEYAHSIGMDAAGIDGDDSIDRNGPILIHDFTKGHVTPPIKPMDLAWSVEFLEHVDAQYMDYYMSAFKQCRMAVVTAAPPGTPGHNHVNCQTEEYWIEKFNDYGFDYAPVHTEGVRKSSTMGRDFMRDNGMLFIRRDT